MKRVKHQVYGKGTVIKTSGDIISVRFDNGKQGEFLENYLTFLGEEPVAQSASIGQHEIVYANTNADFLNKRFGTNYKAWMKCGWDYDNDTIVWMVPFDSEERQGWINKIVDSNTVREDYVGLEAFKLVGHKYITKYHRIVVKKESGRYVVLGLYRYDFENSDEAKRRIWIKVSNSI